MDRIKPEVILCPTDFSDAATFALQYAKIMAEGFLSRLVVLYAEAFEPPPYFTSDQEMDLVKSLARSRRAAEFHLSRYVRAAVGEKFLTESLMVEGLPVPAILKAAQDRNADWIIMGTHGRSGWSRVRLGSVTERVLEETDRPVLTVRIKKGSVEPSPAAVRHVLCPVNYTGAALQALRQAVAIVERFSAELVVIHVLESAGLQPEAKEMERLCGWIPEDIRSRCQLKEIIRRGNAAEQILEAAASTDCDMIVLGAQHKPFWDTTVIGSTTTRVTRHAPCPVLSVIFKEI